jgi:hypothetical protein
MAASTALHPYRATHPQSSTATSTQPSFSTQCIEDLSPDKVSSSKKWSIVYLVAAGATAVAYTIFAAGLSATAAILAAPYAPFVSLGAILGALPIANFVKTLLESSQSCEKEANQYRAIQECHQTLIQQGPQNAHVELMRRGINWANIPGQSIHRPNDVAAVYPVLARAIYLDRKAQEDVQLKEDLIHQADVLESDQSYVEHRQKAYELRNAALFTEQRAMEAKIEAAFADAVLRKGNFNGSLKDVGFLSSDNAIERMLRSALNGSSGAHGFFTFANRNLAPITFNEVRTMTVAQLGQRIAAAMN